MLYTNGAYEVEGYLSMLTLDRTRNIKNLFRGRREMVLNGTVVKSLFSHIHVVGEKVEFPLYHLFDDEKPQFISVEQMRDDSLKELLK